MNRRAFLTAIAGAPAILAQKRPNFIVILADDLGWGDISANGAPDIRTPAIDRIAREGVRFTQSYCSAPECTPTRTALLTGRYPQRAGGLECAIGVNNIGRYDEAAWLQKRGELGLPPSEDTLAMQLRRAGYDTALFGKWHLGYAKKHWPAEHGFAESFGFLGGNADYFTHEEENEGAGQQHFFRNRDRTAAKGYTTDLFAEAAIDWLKKRSGVPFLLYLPFNAPHTPIQAFEDYDPETGTAPRKPRHRPTYARMVQRMDQRISDVLAALSKTGAADDTMVIFMSDNGADVNGRNDPFKGRKSSLWEGAIRSPMHIRWPKRIQAGTDCSQVALTMDVTRTVLTAAGIQGGRTDGIDLMPIISGKRAPAERSVCWRYKRAALVRKAIRRGHWKYVNDNGTESVYDLAKDPGETTDLARGRPDLLNDLRRRLADWEKDVQSPRLRDFRPDEA